MASVHSRIRFEGSRLKLRPARSIPKHTESQQSRNLLGKIRRVSVAETTTVGTEAGDGYCTLRRANIDGSFNQEQLSAQQRASLVRIKGDDLRPAKPRKMSRKNTSPVSHLPGLPSPPSLSAITRSLRKDRLRRTGTWKAPNAFLSTMPINASGKTINLPLGLDVSSPFQGNVSSFAYLDPLFFAPYPTSLASKALPALDVTPTTETDPLCDTMDQTSISESEWVDVIDILERHKGEFFNTMRQVSYELYTMMMQKGFGENEAERRIRENVMCTTHCGRVYVFVERVIMALEEILVSSRGQKDSQSAETAQIRAVATDAMFDFAQRLLEKQEEFRKAGKPAVVDLGYHYTEKSNMENIRTGGLMTRTERKKNNIKTARKHGSFFGDGVYTGNNPIAFTQYGTAGLLVARLKGQSRWILHIESPIRGHRTIDTVVGNKGYGPFYDEVVLAESSQCLPIVEFPTSLITRSLRSTDTNNPLVKIEMKMQQVVDELFNGRFSEPVKPSWCSV
jgi:hypothetical protein